MFLNKRSLVILCGVAFIVGLVIFAVPVRFGSECSQRRVFDGEGFSAYLADLPQGIRSEYFRKLEAGIREQSAKVRQGERGIHVYLEAEGFELVEAALWEVMREHAAGILEEEFESIASSPRVIGEDDWQNRMTPEETEKFVTNWLLGQSGDDRQATIDAVAALCLHAYELTLCHRPGAWERNARWFRTYIAGGFAYPIKQPKVFGDARWVDVATDDTVKIKEKIRHLLNLQQHRPVEIEKANLAETMSRD